MTLRVCAVYFLVEPAISHHETHESLQRLTLECLEEWSEDPKYYRGQATTTPGCPSFPSSQWTLLFEGRAPDLDKVLSGHYSTTIDPKQSQVLGKGFEISLTQPTTTHHIPLPSLCLGRRQSSEDIGATFSESFGMCTTAFTPKSLTSIEHAGSKSKCESTSTSMNSRNSGVSKPLTSPPSVWWPTNTSPPTHLTKLLGNHKMEDENRHISIRPQGERFETLLTLANHPNPAFVKSVCQGLCKGFWPWADMHYGVYPTTLDIPSPSPSSDQEWNFLQDQIVKEESVGRYSRDFGPDLLPGMYSMPIHAVPKEGGKFCLVMNHSTGDFSLNSMISKEDIAGITLDNVQDLGDALHLHHQSNPHNTLRIWKADVSEAYRHMPMHPLWQIKQVVMFEGQRRIDRANVFGGRASQRIFHAFMSLVMWLAVFVRLIQAFLYVDDSFFFCQN
ncbi:uncharacterized protein F5891DRAFT_1182335 [Suillus fuscotomentosus]|uniref:Uncharacterized protein n=1 Tax=Suillus fuscotomentosus TaxID=1912939 RepID=A0AAD4HSR2_9AGAM|nr:uncharacterized protein F5891DRAFT_1182335 [Suillus fuscotomentosus]KAG1906134.1 hypothetical protein F5891DRAFT_1182335 [Suillus fuscotomentosus]